jgi:hypothetical protein
VGQLLHGSARTTPALRRTIQHSRDSIARLAARHDLNAKKEAVCFLKADAMPEAVTELYIRHLNAGQLHK